MNEEKLDTCAVSSGDLLLEKSVGSIMIGFIARLIDMVLKDETIARLPVFATLLNLAASAVSLN